MDSSDLNARMAALRQGKVTSLSQNTPFLPGNVLAQSQVLQVPDGATEQYLVFSLLEREFAFKAECVQGVERLVDITPVPNLVPWIKGVINLRGAIVSVVDFRAFLDMEVLPFSPRTRMLSIQYNQMVICFVVDSVSDMVAVPISAITQSNETQRPSAVPQWVAPYASGSATIQPATGGRRSILLLDAARLLFSDKMLHYQALE